MRARLTVPLAGHPMRAIGEEVTGDDALRLVEAGYAVPIVDTAPAETATKKRASKETR